MLLKKGEQKASKVSLTLPPANPVNVNVSTKNDTVTVSTKNKSIDIMGDSLEFTPNNWMIPQEITVSVSKRISAEDHVVITFSDDDLENVEVPVRVK